MLNLVEKYASKILEVWQSKSLMSENENEKEKWRGRKR